MSEFKLTHMKVKTEEKVHIVEHDDLFISVFNIHGFVERIQLGSFNRQYSKIKQTRESMGTNIKSKDMTQEQLISYLERKTPEQMDEFMGVVRHNETSGSKHDQKKPKWHLLPLLVIQKVVEVLTFGAIKYSENNWKSIDDYFNRYLSATLRHITARQNGEILDEESKLPHLAHAICCLIFIMWFDMKEDDNDTL